MLSVLIHKSAGTLMLNDTKYCPGPRDVQTLGADILLKVPDFRQRVVGMILGLRYTAAESFDLATWCNALPYMSDVPGALQRWREFLRPGGRPVFNCWAEDSHATGRLLRAVAAHHDIVIPVVGWDTGTPERCRTVLTDAGCSRIDVIVEPTTNYWSADRLLDVFEAALRSPLFKTVTGDLDCVEGFREEYAAKAQSSDVLESLETEKGAYFVSANR